MQLANLVSFIEVLSANAAYQPNEPDLTIASLQTLHAELTQKAQAVTTAQVRVEAARLSRDQALYAPGTGLVDVGLDVKSYVKAALGPNSANYNPILSLEFRRARQ